QRSVVAVEALAEGAGDAVPDIGFAGWAGTPCREGLAQRGPLPCAGVPLRLRETDVVQVGHPHGVVPADPQHLPGDRLTTGSQAAGGELMAGEQVRRRGPPRPRWQTAVAST